MPDDYDERLRAVEQEQVRIVSLLEQSLEIGKKILHKFEGNGKPGYDVRLDRLERNWKIVLWAVGLCTTVSGGVLARTIYDFFAGGGA